MRLRHLPRPHRPRRQDRPAAAAHRRSRPLDDLGRVLSVLGAVDGWDVPVAAAAVFGIDAVLDQHGPMERSFRLASVSKVLTAVTVHVAIEEGTVALDHPAGPDGSTVRHLLAHASGLPPDGDRTPLGPPERKRIYSNVGFEVLGEHLAAQAEMPFDEYARLALVEPLGLPDTTVRGSPAHGYEASAADLVTVVQAVVTGRMLAAATVEVMTAPAFPELAGVLPGFGSQDPNPWGLGVEVRGRKHPHWTAPDNSVRTWGHFGRSGTFVWWDPEAELGLLVLTEREFGDWAAEQWPLLSAEVLAEHR